MTDPEWGAVLAAGLSGTDWVAQSGAVTQGFPYAIATLENRATHEMKVIKLPLGSLRMPETIAAEIRRQLAE
jgi:hypothetical protein